MMKSIIAISSLIISLVMGCAEAQELKTNKKILVVYFSRTGNTQEIARLIHQKVGGELVALELEKPYPTDYKTTVQQVANENERGYFPPLKTKIDNMQFFDVVFIGFPTWGMQLPPPMKSFLNEYDLKGKTVIPFNTNAGYGIGSSFQTVEEMCPGAKVLKGFSMKGGEERDGITLAIKGEKAKQAEKSITKWLQEINLTKAP
jgi:flavodoxin